jgi:hypothetical protein
VVLQFLFLFLKRSLTISTKTLTHAVWATLLLVSTVHGQTTTETAAPPAAKVTVRQEEWLQATIDQRVKLAERLGEEGAEAFATKKGYEPLLRNGDKVLRQGFDQVYRATDGSIVVIEAKGGTSAISRAYGCEQGTPEWAVQAAKRVAENSKASAAEKQAARLVLEAAKEGKLTVQVVRTRHVLGEPVAAVLESSLKAGQAEAKIAGGMLEELGVGVKAAQSAGQAARTAESASKAASGASTLSKVGKVAGVVGVAVDGGLRINSAMETEEKFEKGEISNKERELAHAKNAAGMAGGWCGAIAGAKLGAAGGGAVGTAVVPGPGTAVGAALGGAAGGVAGYFGG